MLRMPCRCALGTERSYAILFPKPSFAVAPNCFKKNHSSFSSSNFVTDLRFKGKLKPWRICNSSSSSGRSFNNLSSGGDEEHVKDGIGSSSPPQEAVLKVISEVSKTEGRVAQTLNVVMGGTVSGASDDEWKELDQKVNTYPTVRGFTAIGSGGEDFVQAMVGAVESVLQSRIPEGRVRHRLSSQGKYVSVKIGPVTVVSSDQVQEVYIAMKRDVRMKYFL